jgi:Na+/H+ antiporter NhaC
MAVQEMSAQLNGDLGGLDDDSAEAANPKGKVIDLIFPVVLLIITCTIGMIYVGGFFGVDAWGDTGCAGDFIGAFGNTDAFIGLPWGGIIALIITIIYMVARRVLSFKDAMACLPKGFIAMVPPITILTMACSLKTATSTLGAAEFVHGLMVGASASLYSMLPAVIFVVACILAFASGTSWGTFGILIPIVTAIFPTSSKLLIIGISACCAGAVCGDHCSPISDTTIMASAGAQVEHIKHVSTQLPYAITVAAVSFITYIVAGFVQNAIICFIVGAVLTVAVLFVIRSQVNKKAA